MAEKLRTQKLKTTSDTDYRTTPNVLDLLFF